MSILKQKVKGVARPLSIQIDTPPDDNQLVHRTGAETVFGEKTFMNKVIVPTPAATSNNNDVATTAFVKRETQPNFLVERAVGTIDGSTIYEKTFSFVTPREKYQDTVVIDLESLNIDEVISIVASLRDTEQAFVPLPYCSAGRNIAITGYVYQKKSYRVTVFEDSFLLRKGYVTITYTKN